MINNIQYITRKKLIHKIEFVWNCKKESVFLLFMDMPFALVCGAGGFIGGSMVHRLLCEGYRVRAVDIQYHEFYEWLNKPHNNYEFVLGDLRDPCVVSQIVTSDLTEIYQFAADMGGAEYIFTGEHDAQIMHNSAMINLNVLEECRKKKVGKIFYSSSACIYPAYNQLNENTPTCEEKTAYPADPDSEYGWEKLFSEHIYLSYMRNYGMQVRIARFHNIFGPKGTWKGGKEKAPAAFCRKISLASNGDTIDMFGDGKQTRSFLYIDECLEGIRRLMNSDFTGPVNIGSEEMISINGLAEMVMDIACKKIHINHIDGPLGVRGRNSHNELIKEKLGWAPNLLLREGVEKTYAWIHEQIFKNK